MTDILIIRDRIAWTRLDEIARSQFGDMVKGVVDVTRGILAVDGELQSDEEVALLDDGSGQAAVGNQSVHRRS